MDALGRVMQRWLPRESEEVATKTDLRESKAKRVQNSESNVRMLEDLDDLQKRTGEV